MPHTFTAYNTTWFAGRDPQRAMKAQAALTKAKCQLVMQDPETGYRQYACYPTWPEALRYLEPLQEHARYISELLPRGHPVKPYAGEDPCPAMHQLYSLYCALVDTVGWKHVPQPRVQQCTNYIAFIARWWTRWAGSTCRSPVSSNAPII